MRGIRPRCALLLPVVLLHVGAAAGPPAPVVDIDRGPAGRRWGRRRGVDGPHRHAAGRPFVWIDDEITGADRAWVAERHPGPALLHRVDPGRGLTVGDFTALREWLSSV